MNPFSKRRRVSYTPEFERIRDLPTRVVQDPKALSEAMTLALRKPGGTMSLRPAQALALYELTTVGGLCAPMGVGSGKTLVSLLAPNVLGLTRAILLIPAALIEKTERERRDGYLKHWHIDTTMQIFSYQMLGRVNASDLLENKHPDGIICDEVHLLKNKKAACTRRVSRWMAEHPETRFVAMSGTILGKSLHDLAHILRWSLGDENAPVPRTEGELSEWADALDERVPPLQRIEPGALQALAPLDLEDTDPGIEDEDKELRAARKAFHNRLTGTPGVVASLHDDQVNCSLYIRGQTYEVNATTQANFKRLREEWTTPDGWALSEAMEVWRHARELCLGLHYLWDPRPPDDWLEARRAWAKYVREELKASRVLDSEKQVADECEAGRLPREEYDAWQKIKDTFAINQVVQWHDASALDLCAKWLAKSTGICWVEHRFFGFELARRTGLPYYGQDGLTDDGRNILDASGSIIASRAANGTGKNLQAWNRNLIVTCPTGASIWEQLVGRTHRQGQTADEVHVDVLLGSAESFAAWERAQGEARMAADILGSPQKILLADISMPQLGGLTGSRWDKTVQRAGVDTELVSVTGWDDTDTTDTTEE